MAAGSGAEPQAVLDELSNEIDRLNRENAALRQRVQLLTHRLFGRRSEKGVPVIEQGVLPFEPAAAGPVQPETTDESPRDETAEPASFRRRHPGRRRLPADLPRERIEVVPPAVSGIVRTATARRYASVRTSPRNWTTYQRHSESGSMCDRSTPVDAASKAWCRPPCRRVPSKRDDRDRGYWRTWSHPSTRIICRVSAGADLRTSRSADHPSYPLGVERGHGRLTRTDRARHAPGAATSVALDSMRRHDLGCAGPESRTGDSDRASVGVSG